MDKGKHIVKLATVDMSLVRTIKKQEERHGHMTVWTHTWVERETKELRAGRLARTHRSQCSGLSPIKDVY